MYPRRIPEKTTQLVPPPSLWCRGGSRNPPITLDPPWRNQGVPHHLLPIHAVMHVQKLTQFAALVVSLPAFLPGLVAQGVETNPEGVVTNSEGAETDPDSPQADLDFEIIDADKGLGKLTLPKGWKVTAGGKEVKFKSANGSGGVCVNVQGRVTRDRANKCATADDILGVTVPSQTGARDLNVCVTADDIPIEVEDSRAMVTVTGNNNTITVTKNRIRVEIAPKPDGQGGTTPSAGNTITVKRKAKGARIHLDGSAPGGTTVVTQPESDGNITPPSALSGSSSLSGGAWTFNPNPS